MSSSEAGSNTSHPDIQCNLYPSFSNASFFFLDIVHFFWSHSHLYKQCIILPDSFFLCMSFYSSFWILSPHPHYSHNDRFWGGGHKKKQCNIFGMYSSCNLPHTNYNKLKSAQKHYVPFPCTKFHPNLTIKAESIDGSSFTLLSMAFTVHFPHNSQLLDKFLYTSSLSNFIPIRKYSSIIP